ncbi:MAG: N-6 DNA methylase [Bdellovibrionales bacterium]|nr:N-6 DNA methylase [Bdellovibrionales bacterium]
MKGNIRPDTSSLLYTNQGLFSDNFLENRLLNSDEYDNDQIFQHWEQNGSKEYESLYAWMLEKWKHEHDEMQDLSEAQLEEVWIRPILERLGWTFEVQKRSEKRGQVQIPDYVLFDSANSLRNARASKDRFFDFSLAVADAKKMGTSLDGSKSIKGNPSHQIIRYLVDAKKEWGILTDGQYWRLYSLKPDSRHLTFFEVDCARFLCERDDTAFNFFYAFFRKDAFVPDSTSKQSFLDVIFEQGELYAEKIESSLKKRAFRIVEGIAKGFLSKEKTPSDKELESAYEKSLSLLFRLMFILNCESKRLLDVNELSAYFPHSLRRISIDIKRDFEIGRKPGSTARTFHDVVNLFGILKSGDERIGIHGFGEEVFPGELIKYFEKHPIPDYLMHDILLDLACAVDSEDGGLKFIDYKKLAEDHLGSIFEGLLEFRFVRNEEKDLLVIDGEVIPLSDATKRQSEAAGSYKVKKGDLYLKNDSLERKASGAYYTPKEAVRFIVRNVISEVMKDVEPSKLSELRFLDPAMGSGHFLLGVVRELESWYVNSQFEESGSEGSLGNDNVRWEIMHNCIYGVDLNPIAVELAKFSLWIYSATRDKELEPLNDQFLRGNTLSGEVSPKSFKIDHFDAIVGNPPYSGISQNKNEFIEHLLKGRHKGKSCANYYEIDGKPLNEKKVWLQDDYVKFIRWCQLQSELGQVSHVAMLTNHSFIDNPTFRGMRQQLLKDFSVTVLELNGSVKKPKSSENGKDENIFDIQQGVSIIFMSSNSKKPGNNIRYFELIGPRKYKKEWLSAKTIDSTKWRTVKGESPYYFFNPNEFDSKSAYSKWLSITDLFKKYSTGIVTARDKIVYDFDESTLVEKIDEFRTGKQSDDFLRKKYFGKKKAKKYLVGDTRGWKLKDARAALASDKIWKKRIALADYRPFDQRYLYYSDNMVDWPRTEIMKEMDSVKNSGIYTCRQTVDENWSHVLPTSRLVDDCFVSNKTKERGYLFPAIVEGKSNVSERFIKNLKSIGVKINDSMDGKDSYTSHDVVFYALAILFSDWYQKSFAPNLKVEFPRLPLPSSEKAFKKISVIGQKVFNAYTLQRPFEAPVKLKTSGSNLVSKIEFEENGSKVLVWINEKQYFDLSPTVWDFSVGAYQICQKWLKDRKGRKLSSFDIEHYNKVIAAIGELVKLKAQLATEIDEGDFSVQVA